MYVVGHSALPTPCLVPVGSIHTCTPRGVQTRNSMHTHTRILYPVLPDVETTITYIRQVAQCCNNPGIPPSSKSITAPSLCPKPHPTTAPELPLHLLNETPHLVSNLSPYLTVRSTQ